MFNNRNHVQDDRFLPTIIWLKLGLDGPPSDYAVNLYLYFVCVENGEFRFDFNKSSEKRGVYTCSSLFVSSM